jgi:GNAT superfamily N-acetyltransferase
MPFRVVPFAADHVPAAARMFVDALDELRRRVPVLPGALADVDVVRRRLEPMRGYAALEGERLVGYLTAWFPLERFRGADRLAAYSPEWAHAGFGPRARAVANELYRAASMDWSDAGCDTHAITLLAGDAGAVDTWVWSGFGMGTVDGIRLVEPLGTPSPSGFAVRMAMPADAAALASLDVEHQRHYSAPPVFMAPRQPRDAAAWARFLETPGNAAWLAADPDGPFGFMQFTREFNASAVVESPDGIFISGAYVPPRARGRGAGTALLDAGLRHYAAVGTTSCAVDFEAFNPEAAAFWPRHFTTVCMSLMRVPEWPPA